ncbi:hypothetical protein OAG61_03135, partial [Akkermansiaceae bacterium]|nr:hypothetical protein [Akkermansiaceae bacterium]
LLTLIISVSSSLNAYNLVRGNLLFFVDVGGGCEKRGNSGGKVRREIPLISANLRIICRRYEGFAR